MAKMSKRIKEIRSKIDRTRQYTIDEGLALLKECSLVKFDESVDASINLGVDPRKSDQNVRGSSVLPNGTGKQVRVAVFTQGENADKATAAGADVVGMQELAESMKGGDLNYDVVIASPDAMGVVGQLGQLLGPRGLMPNPKVGTVSADVATAVQNAKAGQVRYRTDKGGIIHCTIGKSSFEVTQLRENLEFLLTDLKRAKPASSKGVYLKKISISTTMGVGISVEPASLGIKWHQYATVILAKAGISEEMLDLCRNHRDHKNTVEVVGIGTDIPAKLQGPRVRGDDEGEGRYMISTLAVVRRIRMTI